MGEPEELVEGVGEINLAGGGFWKTWGEVEEKAPTEMKNPRLVRTSYEYQYLQFLLRKGHSQKELMLGSGEKSAYGPIGKSRHFSGHCLFNLSGIWCKICTTPLNLGTKRAKCPSDSICIEYMGVSDCDIAPKGTRSKRIRPQSEQKESTTGSPLTKEVCHIRDKGPLAKSQEAKSDRKREQRRLHPSQGDAPAAKAKAPAAKTASAAEAKAAAAAAAAQDRSTGETAVFVNDQPEKGGARTQDEVLKDLAELSKISSAAKAGLLGADAVLRLDNDTPPGPILNGEEDD
eukprot:g73919.t1